MDFPNEFNISTFPAGPRIAISRVVSIAIMLVFFLIMVTCAVLLWAQKSVQIHPFLVSVNNITGQWQVVGHNHDNIQKVPLEISAQESVIGKFLQNWFLISNSESNETVWQTCERAKDCTIMENSLVNPEDNKCALYCVSGDELYADFKQKIMPEYQKLAKNNVKWYLDMPSLQITKIQTESGNNDLWQIRAMIISQGVTFETIEVLGYLRLGFNPDLFPITMGYFVSEFNAYKMN